MKMTKKRVFVVALAVALIALVSMGTLAWFTAEDSVKNEFFVADSNTPDAEGVFGIDVWEKDENGNIVSKDPDTDGMVFEKIIAGDELTKEPHLENTGIHPMWVRATVTITGADVLKNAIDEMDWMAYEKLLAGKDDGQWVVDSTTYNPETGELVHVLYYQKVLEVGAYTEQLFTTVLIPEGLTVEQAEELDKFDIVILGEAIQSENLGVSSAKEAFETYWEEAHEPLSDYNSDPTRIEYYGPVEEISIAKDSSIAVTNGVWASDPEKAEALITIDPVVHNLTLWINGGDFTLQDGDLLVDNNDQMGGLVIYIGAPITVNGTEVARADLAQYFDSNVLVFAMY